MTRKEFLMIAAGSTVSSLAAEEEKLPLSDWERQFPLLQGGVVYTVSRWALPPGPFAPLNTECVMVAVKTANPNTVKFGITVAGKVNGSSFLVATTIDRQDQFDGWSFAVLKLWWTEVQYVTSVQITEL